MSVGIYHVAIVAQCDTMPLIHRSAAQISYCLKTKHYQTFGGGHIGRTRSICVAKYVLARGLFSICIETAQRPFGFIYSLASQLRNT